MNGNSNNFLNILRHRHAYQENKAISLIPMFDVQMSELIARCLYFNKFWPIRPRFLLLILIDKIN